MYDFFCHLRDNLSNGGVITMDDIKIASGKATLTPEHVKKILTEKATRTQSLEEAFQKQQERAAVSFWQCFT